MSVNMLVAMSKMGVVLVKHKSESQWTVLLGYLTISLSYCLTIMSFVTILSLSVLHSIQSNCCSA